MMAPEDVKPHLGKPTHYREGRSAFCLADSWFAENGLPEPIRATLETVEKFEGAELLEGFFEREVSLSDGGRHSQTDLLALLSVKGSLVVMSVEGKVDEPFGKLVSEELGNASPLKRARIDRLSSMFGVTLEIALPLRYQLFHRTAAAIFEAQRFCSRTAVMMVHSFDANDAGANDYSRFSSALGFAGAEPTCTVGPKTFEGIDLYLGWTADRP